MSSANYSPLIAPGGIFSIFGSGLATSPGGISSTPYPLDINGTKVFVNGEQAPLLYVSPTVVNAQMPTDVPLNTAVFVTVSVGVGVLSQAVNVTVIGVAPALFTADGTGKRLIATQHLNFSKVTGDSPAVPGEEVVLYGTGLGATNPPLLTNNSSPPAGAPAAEMPVITMGGQPAQVLYAGAAGVYPGLYQINLIVPNVVAGDQEVVIRMPTENIGSSQGATVPIGGSTQGTPIYPSFFGLHVSPAVLKGASQWPTFDFGPLRLHDDVVPWSQLNPSAGNFNWTTLDAALAGALAKGKTDITYTFVGTPPWAASSQEGCTATGKCPAPPSDLNLDGTGQNQLWKDFVTAIAQRYAGEIPGKIGNWEIWNEPNAKNFWTGTVAQLVRMQKDAAGIIKRIDPQARILTPAPADAGNPSTSASGVSSGALWMGEYLLQGGGQFADVIAFHGYIDHGSQPQPEDVLQGEAAMALSRVAVLLTGLQFWNTEASWGKSDNEPDPDMQAAYCARSHLVQAGTVDRYYWYHYDYPEGRLFDASVHQLTKAGVAFGQVFNWLTGAALTQACSTQGGTVWTCAYARQNGFEAMAVWDAAQTCSIGSCTTSLYNAPSSMVKYGDLSGNTFSIAPGTPIQIGAKPIWLTNQ